MNRIITLSREFGSGGRELGRRIAEQLGIAYYDKEILTQIAEKTQLAESYVQQIIERKPPMFFPITIGQSFAPISTAGFDPTYKVLRHQHEIITEMAQKSDCLIVGRCADYILRDMNPLSLFVYAEKEHKLARCIKNAPVGEDLSNKELEKKIAKLDKNRAEYYEFFTGKSWGDIRNYDLCINTTNFEIKDLANHIVEAIKHGAL